MPWSDLKRRTCRHCLVIAMCVSFLATPLSAQDTVDPALQLYFSGNAVYNRKQYPIAVSIYTEFLSKYGTHEKAQLTRYGLGLSQFALKQYDRAAPEFQKLVDEKKLDEKISRDRLVLLHAQCLLYTNQNDEAQKRLLKAATTLQPGVYRTGAIAGMTDLYFSKSDWPNTIAWAQKLKAAKPSSAQAIRAGYQEGYALYKLEKLPDAIAILNQTKTRATAANSDAWVTRIGHLLSECHISDTNLDKAESSLQSALAGLKGNAAIDARFRLATIKFTRKKWVESQADFETFLKEINQEDKADPRIREAEFRVARCLMEQGEKEQKQANKALQQLTAEDDEIAARAILWRGRLYSRNAEQANRYAAAVAALKEAVDKKWYGRGFPANKDQEPRTIVADIDFEYANALMLQDQPDWNAAYKLLQRVEQRRRDYRHMAEVKSQQAICQHKLKNFPQSYANTTEFLKAHADDELAGDTRFLHAENLFMMKKYNEATAAYGKYLAAHEGHDSQLAGKFRIAQIHHHQEKWAESNKLAVPLLDLKPEGELFSQLAFVVGENYFRLGKWADAAKPLEAFLATYLKPGKNPKAPAKLQRGPDVDAALMQLGIACARESKKEDAIGHLEILIKGYSTDTSHLPLALAEQGKLLYETDELGKARQVLEMFVRYRADKNQKLFNSKSTPEVGRVHYYLGWIDAAQNRHAEAAVNFGLAAANSQGRRGKDGNSLDSDALLQQGIALVNAKEFEKAAAHLHNLAQRYKDHPRIGLVTYYAGLAYARVEKWSQAAAYFERVSRDHPDAPFADKAVYEWAWCERAQKRTKEATERYELLLAKYGKSLLVTQVQSELAELNLDVGAQDAVIAKLTETIKTATEPKLKFELKYQLASAHFKKQDYEGAAPMFEALLPDGEKSELLPSILFQAGESRLALTETVPAREHYRVATLLGGVPASLAESILLRLGETQNMTGQHKEAQDSYNKFLKQYRESKWTRNAQYGVAFAIEKQQNYKKAIGEYAKLMPTDDKRKVKMDKWLVQGRYQIGECYFNLQQYDKAMAEFASVDANGRGYPDWQAKAVLEMGRIMLSLNKQDDALARMKEVLKRFPKTKAADVAQKYLDDIRAGG